MIHESHESSRKVREIFLGKGRPVSRRSSGYQQAFAIVRYDRFQPLDPDPGIAVTVKKSVWTQEAAENEVKRLNAINSDKDCVYFWTSTRVAPQLLHSEN